ncbi:probable insulin-like peptide 5 [Drosophila nasuta]|uniref:probable insulin-like peptide 5 n=1 Tax=Drosophila nasuta TaxID=42062 RepID=UPI00295E3D81|nr:probable insulin-like peptide 5 [Drosophila nasuta]
MNKCKQTQLMVVSLSLLLVLLLTVAVNNVNGAATVQVCGSALSDTLFLYCRGQFSGLPVHKRGSLDLFDYVEQQPGNELDLDDTMTHLSHGPAASSVLATRRLHRGVVDECCRKPCTYAEMSNYCLN